MSLLSVTLAFAIAPPSAPLASGVGIEPHRLQYVHPAEQLRQQGAAEVWDDFADEHGEGWQVQMDEANHTVRALHGPGVPLTATRDAGIAVEVALFVHQWAPAMGLGDGTLVPSNVASARGITYVDFDLEVAGLPVYRGGIRARVKHGRLVLIHAQLPGQAPVTGQLRLDAPQAIAAAIARGPAPAAMHERTDARLVLLERSVERADGALGKLVLRRAWEVRSATASPVGQWVTHIDAETGEVLNVYNEVSFATGEVEGRHHVRTLDDNLVDSPLPNLLVTAGGDSDQTDASGVFDVNGTPFQVDLDGVYFDVRNSAGGEAFISSSSTSLRFDTSNATQAEVSTAVFLSQIRDWGLSVAPEVGLMQEQVEANVNIGDACNAYFDPYGLSVNFYSAGSGCNNTGQIADVVYHEWGHGFHLYSLESGYYDGSMGEGIADIVAVLQTGDPEIGPTFNTGGSGIRNLGPNRSYPDDYVNDYRYVHYNGLIYGGAMWDLLDLLQDDFGAAQGSEILTDIFVTMIKSGPDVPGSYLAAVLADDDDGDLGDGTPHQCQIVEAFGRHGLGPGDLEGGGAVVPVHVPLSDVAANQPAALSIGASSLGCDAELEGGEVFYRTDGGAWISAGGGVSGDELLAELPGFELGTFVEYYAELDTADASGLAPAMGEIAPYTFFAGGVLPLRCDDFEDDDGGFVHELLAGDNVEGADDWQWGRPNGQSGDPSSGFSGDNVWGTDLGYDNFNGAYQDNKHTRLTAPAFETGHYEGVFLQYNRWLNVEDGSFDQSSIYANGERVWTNWDGGSEDHTEDGQWIGHAVDLGGVGDRGTLELSWELETDGGLFFGGWNIDDVCIMAPATADNRLGIVDFEVDLQDDGEVEMAWTNPEWGPLEKVVVVRNTSRLPESVEDGVVVWEDEEPGLGEEVDATDENSTYVAGYYAVYGFDGEEWLGWTIEGWNADQTEGNDDLDELREEYLDGVDESVEGRGLDKVLGGGCGCASGAPSGVLGLPVLLGLFGLQRRR